MKDRRISRQPVAEVQSTERQVHIDNSGILFEKQEAREQEGPETRQLKVYFKVDFQFRINESNGCFINSTASNLYSCSEKIEDKLDKAPLRGDFYWT